MPTILEKYNPHVEENKIRNAKKIKNNPHSSISNREAYYMVDPEDEKELERLYFEENSRNRPGNFDLWLHNQGLGRFINHYLEAFNGPDRILNPEEYQVFLEKRFPDEKPNQFAIDHALEEIHAASPYDSKAHSKVAATLKAKQEIEAVKEKRTIKKPPEVTREKLGKVKPLDTETAIVASAEHGPKYAQEANKGLIERQISKLNAKPETYEGPRVAHLSPKEKEARILHEHTSPFRERNREILNEVQGKLRKNSEEKNISEASKPFLNTASKGLQDLHNELYGKIESDYDQSILDKAHRQWEEKVAPSIKQKYLTPGVRGHGHIAKETGDAYEKLMKGATESILGHRAQNKAQSVQAVQAEKEAALKGANIAGMNAKEDARHNLEATQLLHNANTADELKKKAHTENLRSLGQEERGLQQKQYDIDKQTHDEMKQDENDTIALTHNLATAAPTTFITKNPPHPERPINTMEGTANTLLMGGGAHLLNRKAGGRVQKAGGGMISSNHLSPVTKAKLLDTINNRKKLAKGGSVDDQTDQSDVVQDAVFDGTDMGGELSRQNRRKVLQLAKDNYAKATYAGGGAVNPIVEGANMAKDFVQREKALQEQEMQLREKIMQSYNQPEAEPENKWIGALNAGMKAAATSGNDDFLARGAKAYTTVTDDITSKKAKKAEAQREARKEQAAFAKQLHDERFNEKKHELEKEKVEETKRLHKAQIGHYGAHNKLLEAQANKLLQESNSGLIDGVDPGDLPTKKLTKDDEKSLGQSESSIAAIDATFTAAEKLLAETNKIESGPGVGIISKVPWLGPKIAGVATNSDIGAIENYKADTNSYLEQSTKAETVLKEHGGRYLAGQQKVKEASKPSLSYSQEKNKSLLHTDLSDKLNFYNIQIDRMKRHGAPANALKNAINKRNQYAEIISKIKNLAPNKDNNVANDNSNMDKKKAYAKEYEEILRMEAGG